MAHTRRHRRRQTLLTQLRSAGFPLPFDISGILDRSIRVTQTAEDAFNFAYAKILSSRAFRRNFPGIFRGDGTLRMTPSEYQARTEAFRSIAHQFGFSVSRSDLGEAISEDLDVDEFRIRSTAVQAAIRNPDITTFMNEQIRLINERRRKEGRAPLPQINSFADRVKFFMGRSDRQVYAVYEGALFQQSAAGAGLEISAARAKQLARGTEGVLTAEDAEARFSRIAAQLSEAGPELGTFGISQRDLEIIEFGGTGRAQLAERAERALRQRQAQLQSRLVAQDVTLSERRTPILAGQAPEPGF